MPNLGRKIENGVGAALVRWPLIFFILGLVVVGLSAIGFSNVHLRNDYRSFFEHDDPILERSDWLSTRLGNSKESAVVIYVPGEGTVLSNLSLAQYRHIADAAGALPFVLSSKSLFDAEKLIVFPGEAGAPPRYAAVPFLQGANLFVDDAMETLARDLAATPTIHGRYVARDFTSAAVVVQLDLEREAGSRYTKLERLQQSVRDLERELQAVSPGDRLYLVGSTMFDYASTEILREDVRRLAPLALLLVASVLFVLYRSLTFTLAGLMLIVLPVVATAGIAAGLGWEFSTLSMAGLLLVGTLATADVLHVANSYFLHAGIDRPRTEFVAEAFSHNFWAITATSGTTLVGEIALLFSTSPAVRLLGMIVIVGVAIAWLLCVLMLPLVLLHTKPSTKIAARLMRGGLADVSARMARRPLLIALIFGGLVVVSCAGLTTARIDDSLSSWFSPRTEFRQGMDLLDANYQSLRTMSLAYEVETGDMEAFVALPYVTGGVADIARLSDRLRQQTQSDWLDATGAVRAFNARVLDPAPTSLRPAAEIFGDDLPSEPSSRTLSSAGLMTQFEPGRRDFLVSYFDPEEHTTFASLREADHALAAARDAAPERAPQVQGVAMAFASLSARNFWSVAWGSFIVLGVITVCLIVVFRSVRLGLLSLVPNVAPILFVFAVWSVLGGTINMAAVTVFAVAVGIVVDDTIHFVLNYQRARETIGEPAEAVRVAVGESGTGVLATTLVVGGGFLLLGLSNFTLTAHKAFLVGATIIVAFIVDVIVLPALLALADGGRRKKTSGLT